MQPTGVKSYFVNYRAGDGGRKAPNKRVVIGRHGKISPGRARRLARFSFRSELRSCELAGDRQENPRRLTAAWAFAFWGDAALAATKILNMSWMDCWSSRQMWRDLPVQDA